jgi:hypothetical protein
MTAPIMPVKDWLDRTSSVFKPRSKELQALDTAIANYHAAGVKTPQLLAEVKKQLDAWKRTQGAGDAWKSSTRNKDGYVELLTTQVEKGGDSDTAWAVTPDFMHETLINDRLGVLYLFNHVSVNPKLFNVILEGGLAVMGSSLSYAGADVTAGQWGGGLGDAAAQRAGAAMQSVMVVGGPIIDGTWTATRDVVVKPAMRATLDKWRVTIRNWFTEFVNSLITKLKETWNCELPVAAVTGILNSICSMVLSATQAGVVSGAVDTAKGAILTVDAIMTRVSAWKSGQNVTFVSGHPAAAVDGIKRGMNLSIGEGLWKLLKGAGNIGIAFGTAGAGLIMGIVIAAAEMITKIVIRLFEVTHMRKFFEKASAHWRNRQAADAIHRQPFAFGKFYRKYALVTPALAVLTLNSGVCGSKMSWLSMFKEDGNPISSQAYIQAAAHVDSLKVWGADYLKSAGFSFSSSDQMVASLLKFSAGELELGGKAATAHSKDLSTRGARVRDWLKRAAS